MNTSFNIPQTLLSSSPCVHVGYSFISSPTWPLASLPSLINLHAQRSTISFWNTHTHSIFPMTTGPWQLSSSCIPLARTPHSHPNPFRLIPPLSLLPHCPSPFIHPFKRITPSLMFCYLSAPLAHFSTARGRFSATNKVLPLFWPSTSQCMVHIWHHEEKSGFNRPQRLNTRTSHVSANCLSFESSVLCAMLSCSMHTFT